MVIEIIAILAGLLLPALEKAKESVRRVHCMNNMKQIQLALNMFMLDNDDYLPLPARSSFSTDKEKWKDTVAGHGLMDVQWHHELWDRYLDRNTNVFQCSSNRKMQKAIQQWRENPNKWGLPVEESYKEWELGLRMECLGIKAGVF